MSIWLAVYLIGWAGFTGYGSGQCADNRVSPFACNVVVATSATVWPAYAVYGAGYGVYVLTKGD